MIIPIGHEQTELRRFPVLTLLVMLVCTGVFLKTWLGYGEVLNEIDGARSAALEYFSERPYLELDEADAALLFPAMTEEARELRIHTLRRDYPRRVFDFQVRSDQPALDQHMTELRAAWAAEPYQYWGHTPESPTLRGFFGHMWLHGGWLHLIGNMLFLFVSGYIIEEVWGRPLFTGLYLSSGLVSAAFFSFMHPGLSLPLVGASGAVAGLMGAFAVRFWSTRIRFWWGIFPIRLGTFSAPAWLMCGLWFGLEVLYGWLSGLLGAPEQGGVAHWAHVSGFAFGFASAVVIRVSKLEERFLAPALDAKVIVQENPLVDEALDLRAAGDIDQAFDMLHDGLRKDPQNPVIGMALWELAKDQGRTGEVADRIALLIRKDVQQGRHEAALRQIDELDEHEPQTELDCLTLIRLGDALAKSERQADAVRMLERALPRSAGRPLPAAVGLRLARAAQPLDKALAGRAAACALTASNVEPELRSDLEAIAAATPVPPDPHADAPPVPPLESDEDSAFEHGMVELSEREPGASPPTPELGRESERSAFAHGEIDLSGGDDEPALEATADDGAASPFELGSSFDFGDEDEKPE